MQHLGEVILRSALPRIRRLIRRQLEASRTYSPPAMDTCALLLVAALRLSTSPSGTPVRSPLLDPPTAINFLGVETTAGSSRGRGNGRGDGRLAGNGASAGASDMDQDSAPFSPRELAQKWVGIHLRMLLEGKDPLLVEASAWATLRVLQVTAMESLRASTAPRVAEGFLRLLPTPGRQVNNWGNVSGRASMCWIRSCIYRCSPSPLVVEACLQTMTIDCLSVFVSDEKRSRSSGIPEYCTLPFTPCAPLISYLEH